MPNIDLHFIVLLVGVMGLLMSVIIFFLRRSLPPSIDGLREWAAAPAIVLISMVLLAMRGAIPDYLSILCGNLLLLVGCLLFHVGTQRFFGVATEKSLRTWLIVLILSVPAIAWCSLIKPDYAVRLRLMAVLMFLIFASLTIMVHKRGGIAFPGRFTAVVLFVQSMVIFLRFAATFFWPSGTGLFEPFVYQTIYIASFTFTMLLLTVGTVLLATERMRVEFEAIINEARKAQEALLESEVRFRTILQTIPSVAVQGYAQDGTTRYWNTASERLYGYRAEEAIGRNLLETIIPPEMRSGVREAMRQMFASGQPIPAGELSLMRKDGSRVDVFSSHAHVHVPGQAPEMFCLDIDLTERKRLEEALRFTRTSVEAASDAIFWITSDARIVDVNAAACRSLCYTRAELLTLSVADVDLYYDQSVWPGHFAELREKGTITLESVQRGKDGRQFPVEVVANYVSFGDQERDCAFVRDISKRKQAETELKITHERLELAISGGDLGFWDWQITNGEVLYSERWYSMLGYSKEELNPMLDGWVNLIHPDDENAVKASLDTHLKGKTQAYECEHRVRHKNGHWIWLHDRGKVVEWDKEGVPVRAVGTYFDITKRKMAELELEKLAQVDSLTGLANRRHFMIQAEQELSRSVRYGGSMSLFMVDIDRFKDVNDTYGHQIGDLVLQRLGGVFLETLRDIDRVGRVGGEEFAVVLPQTDGAHAIEVAERLRQHVEASEVALDRGVPLHFTISVGVTTLADTRANIDTLLAQADQALYKAKHLGRNQVCVHGG
jgi:diguanylate cyclase (GGDEF)-like protein/PAS domain S-box-containing protein